MGDAGTVTSLTVHRGDWLRRGKPRSFVEWSALYRWGKLPAWERQVPGYLLRLAREGAGLSQAALGTRLGVSQQAIAQAERWSSNPTVAFMVRWLGACDARLELRIVAVADGPSGVTACRTGGR